MTLRILTPLAALAFVAAPAMAAQNTAAPAKHHVAKPKKAKATKAAKTVKTSKTTTKAS